MDESPQADGGKKDLPQTAAGRGDSSGARVSVVGIGASAGGIQVLQEFFAAMPADSGLTFVVVMHLSPEHESNLAQIIQARTPMRVVQVTDTVKVKRNCVYVIPPNKHLSMVDSMLALSDPQQPLGKRVAIDLFFRTLAEQYGQRAVGLILSGTDSDGTIGLKHIKAQGGVTIAQDPTEAEFNSMPRSAIETGMVDWILPVGQMAPRLLTYVRNEEAMTLPPETDGETATTVADLAPGAPGGPLLAKETNDQGDEAALQSALAFVRSQTGHDFSHYKRATLLRRVARRLQVNSLEDVPSYLEFLHTHPAEARALLQDLLIGVTHFFRDPEAFAALEACIPQLFAGKRSNDQLRVWVPGCATGEEAYSIAILLCEQANKLEAPPQLQVFATDLDEEAIRTAREGIFPATIEADVSQERLRQFFFNYHGRYRIRKEIRETVLFAEHNLLRDSPFSRVDMISCRNLLIYLKPEAQHRVLDVFHFALRQAGLLMLGGSESIDGEHALFGPLDAKHRIFIRRTTSRRALPNLYAGEISGRLAVPETVLPRIASPVIANDFIPATIPQLTPAQQRKRWMTGLHAALIEHAAPPSLVVNENHDILHLSERAGAFLHFSSGEPSDNLLRLVDEGLRLELRSALFRAAKEERNVVVPRVRLTRGGELYLVDLQVRPVHSEESGEKFFLVLFDDKPATAEEQAAPIPPQDHEPVTRHLEEEVVQLRQQLNTTIEQNEASSEELKASNEELQAMNEEMRSAAEELETSKEELQSINEELTTVNQELKSNVEQLSRANSDLQNLMGSTDIATVFLDRRMRINRFTPRVQELFNVIAGDLGRPLSDLTGKLNYPELLNDAERVIRELIKVEREVRADGKWFLARLAPYRTLEEKIDGVVVSFLDITARKHASQELAADLEDTTRLRDLAARLVTEENIQKVYEEVLTASIAITRSDAGTVQVYDPETKDLVLLVARGFEREMTAHFQRVNAQSHTGCGIALKTGKRTFIDFDDETDQASRMHVEAGYGSAQSTPLISRGGAPIGMLNTHWREPNHRPSERELRFLDLLARQTADLFEQRKSEEELRQSEEQFRRAIEEAPIPMIMKAEDGQVMQISKAWTELTGYRPEEVQNFEAWLKTAYGEGAQSVSQHVEELFKGDRRTLNVDLPVRTREGGLRHWSFSASAPGTLRDGRRFIVGMAVDVTERQKAEKSLSETSDWLQIALRSGNVCTWELDVESGGINYSDNVIEVLGFDLGRRLEYYLSLVHSDDLARVEMELSKSIAEQGKFEVEHRIVCPGTSEVLWIYAQGQLVDGDKPLRLIGLTQNITPRKRAEEALRQSREQLRIAVEAARMATWVWNLRDGTVAWNEQHFLLLGFSPNDRPQPADLFFEHLHPADRGRIEKCLQSAIKEREPFEAEFRVLRADGEARWMEGYGHVVSESEGKPETMAGVMSDITERKRDEEALRESEERFRYLVEGAKEYAIFMMDPSNIITHWNQGAQRVFGWTAAEAIGQSARIIFTPEDRETQQAEKEIAIALRKGSASSRRWHLRKDGVRIWVDGVMHRLNDLKTGALRGFAKIARDATADRLTQEKLENRVRERTSEISRANHQLQSEIEQRAMLQQEILLVSEREKRRIGQDLHDSLCQELAATAFVLETEAKKLYATNPAQAGVFSESAQIVNANVGLARDLARGLHPVELTSGDLSEALRELAFRSTHEDVTCSFRCPRAVRIRDQSVLLNLYRIAQEAVSNALKHGKATEIKINLQRTRGKLALCIEDNGKGFTKQKESKGMGLHIMRYRAEVIGGSFAVTSKNHRGAVVKCTISESGTGGKTPKT